jgi:hypothetical protein
MLDNNTTENLRILTSLAMLMEMESKNKSNSMVEKEKHMLNYYAIVFLVKMQMGTVIRRVQNLQPAINIAINKLHTFGLISSIQDLTQKYPFITGKYFGKSKIQIQQIMEMQLL